MKKSTVVTDETLDEFKEHEVLVIDGIQYIRRDKAESIAELYVTSQTEAKEEEIEKLKQVLAQISQVANIGIPYYAYGDNEAACAMAIALNEIQSLTT